MSKSHEEQTNQEIIYGKHAVLEALSGDSSINKFYLQNGLNKNRINDILNMVNKRHIVISEVPKTKLDELKEVEEVTKVNCYDIAKLKAVK